MSTGTRLRVQLRAHGHWTRCRYGDRSRVEGVIVNKRKYMYEEEVKANPSNYDSWFDYIRLSEEAVHEVSPMLTPPCCV